MHVQPDVDEVLYNDLEGLPSMGADVEYVMKDFLPPKMRS
jgi:hypothetical protein